MLRGALQLLPYFPFAPQSLVVFGLPFFEQIGAFVLSHGAGVDFVPHLVELTEGASAQVDLRPVGLPRRYPDMGVEVIRVAVQERRGSRFWERHL